MTKNDFINEKLDSHELIPAIYNEVFEKIITSFECREYTCKLLSEITEVNFDFLLDNLIISMESDNISNNKTFYANLMVKNNLTLILEIRNNHKSRLVFHNNIYKKDYISKRIDKDCYESEKLDIYVIKFDIHNLYRKEFSEFRFIEKDTGEVENNSYKKYHVNIFKILDKYYHKKELTFKEKLIVVLALDNKYDLLDICKTDRILNTVFDLLKKSNTKKLLDDIYSDKYKQKIIDIEKEYEQIEANKIGRIYVAKNMLIDNLDTKIISKYTDIGIDEIRLLKENRTD